MTRIFMYILFMRVATEILKLDISVRFIYIS